MDSGSKVNAQYFIEHILTPMVEIDIPRLFGRDAGMVIPHMDSAPSHTAKKTYEWLQTKQVQFIPKKTWLPDSPDLAPMDYFANGYLKTRLQERGYRTVDGLKKCARDEWLKIPRLLIQEALDSWTPIVLEVHKAQGHAVPHQEVP